MADLERFIELYKSFEIECKVVIDAETGHKTIYLGEVVGCGDCTESPKFNGYGGFYSDVVFDEGGNFLRQGFWE